MKKVYIILVIIFIALIGLNIYLYKDDFIKTTYDLSNETINGITIEIKKVNNFNEIEQKPKTIIIYNYDKYIGIYPSNDIIEKLEDGLDTTNKIIEMSIEDEDNNSIDAVLYECKTRMINKIKEIE